MKKKWIEFEYEGVSFEGILEYNEDNLLSMLGQKVYEIHIKKPLSYSISFIAREKAHPIRKMLYQGIDINLDTILHMVLEEAIAYYFNKDQFISIHDIIERRIDEANDKLEQFSKPLKEQIEKLKEAPRMLKELRKLEVLTSKEYRNKVQFVKDQIRNLNGQIARKQLSLLKEAINENEETKKLFKVNILKLKIKKIKDIDE